MTKIVESHDRRRPEGIRHVEEYDVAVLERI